MKKLISILLLIALCLGAFAACDINVTPGGEDNTPLTDAVAYLRSMYKDNAKVTSKDWYVTGKVKVGADMFTVTWTVDNESIKIVAGDKEGIWVVDLPEENPEEVDYTLTATVADAEGNTATTTFTFTLPKLEKVEVKDDAIVLQMTDADGVAHYVTGIHYLYTSSSGSQKWELKMTDNKAEALPMTVLENDDGTVSFVAEGKYLFCDASNVQFVDEQSDNTKFVLETVAGGAFIKCAVANYNGKAQYLEVYSGYLTCYGMNDTNPTIYTFAFGDATGAAGKLEIPSDGDQSETTRPPLDLDFPEADSTLTIADIIAFVPDMYDNVFSENKYYVTGVITEVYNPMFGNMRITDEDGNILTIYGTYDATGENRYDAMENAPEAGDTVTIYGVIGRYGDTPQVKNGWIVEVVPGEGNETTDTDNGNETTEAENGSETTEAENGSETTEAENGGETTEAENDGENTEAGDNNNNNNENNNNNPPAPPSTDNKPKWTIVIEVKDGETTKYVSGVQFVYTKSDGVTKKNEIRLTENKAEALVFDVYEHADGTVSFVAGDYYLECDGTNVQFVTAESAYTKFTREDDPAGSQASLIKTSAYYNNDETKPQYLEFYKGALTCYSLNATSAVAAEFLFELQFDVSGANGVVSFEPDNGGNSGDSGNTDSGNSGNTGNQGGTTPNPDVPAGETSIPDAIAAADGTQVVVTGVVVSAEAWNTQHNNMSVTIKDSVGNTLYVFRLSTQVGLGDTITVTGTMATYLENRQIGQGATAVIKVVHGDNHTYVEGFCSVCGTKEPVTGETTVNCDFSTLPQGTQYVDETVTFGDVTIATQNNGCHFNTQIRIYASDTNNGWVKISAPGTVTGLSINAGYKAATLQVYGSVNGTDWVIIEEIATSTTYNTYTVAVSKTAGYKYIKLDAEGAQVRVASVSVTYVQ